MLLLQPPKKPPAPHELPQAPQLLESRVRLVQVPLQLLGNSPEQLVWHWPSAQT